MKQLSAMFTTVLLSFVLNNLWAQTEELKIRHYPDRMYYPVQFTKENPNDSVFVKQFGEERRFNSDSMDNPFMKMAGKKYADYSTQLLLENEVILTYDTIQFQKLLSQMREVVEKEGTTDWKLQLEFFEWMLSEKKDKAAHIHRTDEERVRPLNELIKKAQQAGVVQVELKCRNEIFLIYESGKNYELAFEQAGIQAKQLQGISSNDIPEKSFYNIEIGNLYMDFRDYQQAIDCYQQALNDKETEANQWYRLGALNSLGVCYRTAFNDYDRSDSCFYAILETRYFRKVDEANRDNWDGVAEGNIGRNRLLQKEYDKAIPLLKSSITKMLKYEDYAYSSGTAIQLAEIYLMKGNMPEAKRYMDMATAYNAIMPNKGGLPQIYEIKSKYYAAAGNAKLSAAYMDSTLTVNKKLEAQFDYLQRMRLAQREFLSEKKLEDEQINREKIKNAGYQRNLIITFAGLLLLGGILLRYLALYRKKQAAYRELVRKSQEWAQDSSEQAKETHHGIPDETDFLVMNRIEQIMSEEKLYKNALLSIDSLAHKLGVKRHEVSGAINHCKKKSFNAFVNEYRIKEAVRLLSQEDTEAFSIDYFAFDAGFTDRTNFYRVFKKMTGLSPTEFKKNRKD